MIQNSRRTFIKGALIAGGVATAAIAMGSKSKGNKDNGVVSGKSHKKEILYKKTKTWQEYYKAAH